MWAIIFVVFVQYYSSTTPIAYEVRSDPTIFASAADCEAARQLKLGPVNSPVIQPSYAWQDAVCQEIVLKK